MHSRHITLIRESQTSRVEKWGLGPSISMGFGCFCSGNLNSSSLMDFSCFLMWSCSIQVRANKSFFPLSFSFHS